MGLDVQRGQAQLCVVKVVVQANHHRLDVLVDRVVVEPVNVNLLTSKLCFVAADSQALSKQLLLKSIAANKPDIRQPMLDCKSRS